MAEYDSPGGHPSIDSPLGHPTFDARRLGLPQKYAIIWKLDPTFKTILNVFDRGIEHDYANAAVADKSGEVYAVVMKDPGAPAFTETLIRLSPSLKLLGAVSIPMNTERGAVLSTSSGVFVAGRTPDAEHAIIQKYTRDLSQQVGEWIAPKFHDLDNYQYAWDLRPNPAGTAFYAFHFHSAPVIGGGNWMPVSKFDHSLNEIATIDLRNFLSWDYSVGDFVFVDGQRIIGVPPDPWFVPELARFTPELTYDFQMAEHVESYVAERMIAVNPARAVISSRFMRAGFPDYGFFRVYSYNGAHIRDIPTAHRWVFTATAFVRDASFGSASAYLYCASTGLGPHTLYRFNDSLTGFSNILINPSTRDVSMYSGGGLLVSTTRYYRDSFYHTGAQPPPMP